MNYKAYNDPLIPKGTIMKKYVVSPTRKYISDHRVAIAIVGTLTVCAMIRMYNAKELNSFLAEHDLLTEFYQG